MRLQDTFAFTCDWPTWERHPAGDAIVMVLTGVARLLFVTPGESTENRAERELPS